MTRPKKFKFVREAMPFLGGRSWSCRKWPWVQRGMYDDVTWRDVTKTVRENK